MSSWVPGSRARQAAAASTRIAQLEHQAAELDRRVRELGRILANLSEGVVAVDRAGIVVHANPAAIELLKMDPARSVGHHMYVAVPDNDVCAVLEPTLRGEFDPARPVIEREIELVRTIPVTVSIRVTPLRGAARGEPEGAIATVLDITDVRRAESARADFFTNVSHELKTPVTAIRGIVETLLSAERDGDMDDDTRRRFLAKAARQGERLGTLVTDVIALSRIESDPEAMARRPVDLVDIAGDSAAYCAEAAEASGVDIVLEVEAHPALVLGDEEALRQALSNLVINGVTHTYSGARVTITVRRDGEDLVVDVADNGDGIAPEHLPRIFERFYRADPARSREKGGSGLGLSIVKHVALAHHGEVTVESAPGEGTRFSLRLPAADVPPAGPPGT